jgi:serine/threonine protein kinase
VARDAPHAGRPARRVTQPSGIVTDSSGLVTPRALVNPAPGSTPRGEEWFGEYRLLEVLGRGGMASVYKAERRGEIVALKRPLGSLLDNPEFLDRFLREAEIGVR